MMAGDGIVKSGTYEAVDRSWKSTCRAVLGEEIGGLAEYEGWLSEHRKPMLTKKSWLSGKEVFSAITDYGQDARFVALDEIDYGKAYSPLGIDEIKDIDSIIEALGERRAYCGNIVLGNSRNVERSSDVQNSFHILGSNFIYDSEHIAYSSNCRGSRHLFAVVSDYGCSHLIRAFETQQQSRCLEAWKCYLSSDCYFCCSVENSQDAMFSFNLRGKRNVIGNLELTRDRYLALKAKLLAEIRDELMERKRLPSLMEMIDASAKPAGIGLERLPKPSGEAGEMGPIEEGFRKTTSILLGRPLEGIEAYGGWLNRHIPSVGERRSAATGRSMHVAEMLPCDLFPPERLVDQDEYMLVGERCRLEEAEIGSLDSLKKAVGSIGFVNPNGVVGECRNAMLTPLCNTSINVYRCPIASYNECAAYSYWPRSSKYMFGSALAFSSSFCINSYYSMNLARTFETDCSNNCSDAYFLHNCENVRDGMFCFNAKNLRFAIGNAQMEPGDYRKAKAALLEQMADELEKTKSLRWGVFNMGSG
ncbi:MAG: hypothetical protein AB1295_06580 [Candidatus Micrarchaeota archaeon]